MCPRPDGAWALGGAAGGGRGQTLPGAAHSAQELPGEALLQLAAGALVSLHPPGRAFLQPLQSFPVPGVSGKNPSPRCGINCWSWAGGVSVAGGGLEGRGGSSGAVNPCPSSSNHQQPFITSDMGSGTVSS